MSRGSARSVAWGLTSAARRAGIDIGGRGDCDQHTTSKKNKEEDDFGPLVELGHSRMGEEDSELHY